MANNKMLIDAGHPEETRVAIVRGNRVDEFDFESEHKTQIRGNIYLAKVTRVEPSLQAAFVDYGGNRHGFLAFSEIHPDYYQIPIADRQALLEEEAEDARIAAQAEDDEDNSSEEQVASGSDDDEEAPAKPARKRRSRRRNTKKASADAADAADDSEEEASSEATTDEESDSDETQMSADNDSDDVVSEPAAEEPVKKPRRKTSRKKAEPEADQEETEKAKPKTAKKKPAKKESPEDSDAEEKPKKRRTSRKTTKKDEVVAEEAEATPVAEAEETKPKRRTSRKKAEPKPVEAEAEAIQESVEAKAADEASSEAGPTEKKPRRRTSRKAKEAVEVEAVESDSAVAEADAPADEQIEAEAQSATDKPSDEKEAKPKSRSRSRSRRGKKDAPAKKEADDTDDTDGAPVEELGSEDALEEVPARKRSNRKNYKIQEVIKRRQILLVQVVKEERGNKGAALTTYLSLAGRYSVLMPNTARGGGISRKITNMADRKRLKAIASDLQVPDGMGVILRTAGAARAPEDIQRDFEYLMRLWENVRTLTLESTAPCLVYEEGSLIKRSIRDLYDKDTGEILVAGEDGFHEAKNFMAMLMPTHAKNVKLYKEPVPLFARMGVEAQLDAMLQPQVTLKSGGYIIIDQTEALVAIDVNSGRSTRQHSIEETATKTNLEAADEVARQLRLRDLAGLIVIDFIDMEDRRNVRNVEKRLKDALKNDRARIQVGRISHFGLMEMSRQRLRASVLESTTQTCPVCEGLGHVRSSSSVVLSVLRAVEDHLNKNSRNNITVKIDPPTALYLLNSKRDSITDLETRFGVTISIETSETLGITPCTIEKGELSNKRPTQTKAVQADTQTPEFSADEDSAPSAEPSGHTDNSQSNETGQGRKKRRRRRRKKSASNENEQSAETSAQEMPADEGPAATDQSADKPAQSANKKADEAPETVEAEPAVAPTDTSNDNAELEKPARSRRTRRKKSDPVPQGDSTTTENVSTSDETAESDDSKKPKRAGWWQRKFF